MGGFAQKGQVVFGLAFFRPNKFCRYWPSAFTGEDMPPMICHVPCVLSQVCVIRILSVLTTAPAAFAHANLMR